MFSGIIDHVSLFTEGKIIAAGGMGTDTNPFESLVEIDVEENKWKELSPMPTARYATSSFLMNEKLYVIGKSNV